MNKTRQPAQSQVHTVSKSAFWGTIVLEAIALLVFGYFIAFFLGQAKTALIYVAMAAFLFSFIAALACLALTIFGLQQLAAKITFYTLFALGIAIVSIFQGRQPAILSILVIGVLVIVYLLPGPSRRGYWLFAIAGMVVMVGIEWLSPAWRLELDAASPAPAAAIVFALILGWIVFTQSRKVLAASMRTKLVAAFVAISFFAVSAAGLVTNIVVTDQLDVVLENSFSELATRMAKETGETIVNSKIVLDGLVLNKFVQDTVESANLTGTSDLGTLARLDETWRSASDHHSLIAGVLNNELASELLELQVRLPQYSGLFVTDRNGAVIASTDRPSDYYQADERWWQSAWNQGKGKVYIGQPVFDDSMGIYAVEIALPIPAHNRPGIVGILRATVDITELTNVLAANEFGQTGQAVLIFPNRQYLTKEIGIYLNSLNAETLSAIDSIQAGFSEISYDGVESLVSKAPVTTSNPQNQEIIDELNWTIVIHQDVSEARAPVAATTRSVIYIAIAVLISAAVLALYTGGQFVKPVESLTAIAEKLAAGDLSARAAETSQDEVGALARTFNHMSTQLHDLISSLEQRVAARTRNLELAAEVGRAVSQVRDLNVMLKDASELILKEFNLYYVQVYLTDASGSTLKLEAGTGDVGAELLRSSHSLPLDTGSINGRAATEKRSVVISDTEQSATFRRNPLLPDTRGEMAVPLIIADKVVGVLDMQSSEPGVLSTEILPAFEALAGQLAVAIQNANLLAETEEARAEVEKQARRLVRQGWHEYLDAIHKPEQIGFVFDRNQVRPIDELSQSQTDQNTNLVSSSISITGERLGSLVLEMNESSPADQAAELVNAVARQVAQQVENLRLLESAERYRFEAEKAARLQTIEGWQKFIESRSAEKLGYLYDTKEVRPQNVAGDDEDVSMLAIPLKSRDEMIGKLAVEGLNADDQEAVDIINAVADRLSAHIENLRLFEETRQGQVELDKRARQLAAVAEVSSVSSRELNLQKMLESVVHLTQRKFGLYHAHIFLYDEKTDELKIVACGWQEGDPHEGTHGTAIIPLAQEQSLVARAARTRQAVIINDVRNEPGWLPNPLLPETASELAVPLVIGDQILGVLDVQSDRLNAFTEEDASIQTTLAAQVATSLQNARSFIQAQKQAEREAMLNVINQKIQSATSVEAVLQIAARELGHALGAPMTIAQLSMKDRSS